MRPSAAAAVFVVLSTGCSGACLRHLPEADAAAAEKQKLSQYRLTCVGPTRLVQVKEPFFAEQWCERYDGPKHGPYRAYHKNGRLLAEGSYSNGVKNGRWLIHDDSGELEAVEYYRDGKLSSRKELKGSKK